MQPADLLARSGLAKEARVLIGVTTTTWNADWTGFCAWIAAGRQLQIPRLAVEEALLQCVLFCGFPRTISAFEQCNQAWPVDDPPAGGGLAHDEQLAAGDQLFSAIYGKNDTAVRDMLKGFHHELHDFVLEAAYGRILSRPNLASKTRELIAAAVLSVQGQTRQFAGHARGAFHLGASQEEIHEALVTAFADAPERAAEWLARIPPPS